MLIAPDTPFLASQNSVEGEVVMLGTPLDLTGTCRSGTRFGPERMRSVSHRLESYSALADRDLDDIAISDAGDLHLDGEPLATALEKIEAAVARIRARALPIVLGGEHTVTLAAFNAIKRTYPDAMLLQFDAHLDLREDYEGQPLGHATWLYHVGQRWGFDHIVQLGVRSGTREEYRRARECCWSSPDLNIPAPVWDRLRGRPVYLTIDIDVLDPSCAPGTGCPEPGGPGFDAVQAALHSLRGLSVVGMDVTELLPETDLRDITSLAVAKIVRDAALLFGRR